MDNEQIAEMTEYYRGQGAPQDQQMLVALLRDVQEMDGGVLAQNAIEAIAEAYRIKNTMLLALIRRISDLRMDTAPHRLEICGMCRAGAKLRADIERTYGVKSGSVHQPAGFSYHVTPCMKNCKNGPSIRWDGQLYGQVDEALVSSLIGK